MTKRNDIIWLKEVKSTNRYARMNIDRLDNLSVVSAFCQSAGRGQGDHQWHSSPGENLTFTVILKEPAIAPIEQSIISDTTANAVVELLEKHGIKAWIKPPNDIWVDTKKICGILTGAEFSPTESRVIIGVGLNVLHGEEDFPEELRQKAGSLLSVTGKEISLDDAERCLIAHLTKLKEDWPEKQEEYLAFYAEHCLTVGCQVQLTDGTLGTALAIGDDFSLTVRCADGTIRTVRSGEASVRAATGEYI